MLSHIHRFSVFMWTGKTDSHTPRVDAYFPKNGEKISVLKNIRIPACGRGLTSMKCTVEAFEKRKQTSKQTNRNVLLLMGPKLSCWA